MIRRSHHEESGSTLVELILGIVVFAIIGGATAGSLLQMLNTERNLRDRATFGATGDAMAAMVRADISASDGVLGDANDASAAASVSPTAWGCSAGSLPVGSTVLLRVRQTGRFGGAATAPTSRLVHFVTETSPMEPGAMQVVRYVCQQGSAVDPASTAIIAARILTGPNTVGAIVQTTSGTQAARATLRIETLGANGSTNFTSVTAAPRIPRSAASPNVGGGVDDGEGKP